MEKLDTADQLLKQGKYSEAIGLLEEIHQACPEEESVLLMLAWAHYDNGDTAKAVTYLEILLKRELARKVFTGFAYDELVRIYKQEKNFSKLVEICTKAVAVQPEDTGLLIELGNAYLQAGKPDDACLVYEKLTQLENDNSAFHCLFGEALFAAGKTSASEAAYLRAAENDPEQADNYYFKVADLFTKGGYYQEAKRLMEACIAAKPGMPLYHCCMGDVFVGLGLLPEALAEYETAIHYDAPNAGAYYNRLGNTLARANHHYEAMEAFRKALSLEPGNPFYIRNLALSYKALELMDEAKAGSEKS